MIKQQLNDYFKNQLPEPYMESDKKRLKEIQDNLDKFHLLGFYIKLFKTEYKYLEKYRFKVYKGKKRYKTFVMDRPRHKGNWNSRTDFMDQDLLAEQLLETAEYYYHMERLDNIHNNESNDKIEEPAKEAKIL